MAVVATSLAVPRIGGGVRIALRGELTKLALQRKIQAILLAAVLAPFLFVSVLDMQSSLPEDTLFGRWVHTSGVATPLVVLGFVTQWALPALTSIVAGDIFSAEDRYGTWKTILTRSRSRGEIFAAKTVAALLYTVAVVVLLGLCSLAAGFLLVGRQPLVGLSGALIGPGHASLLVLASWASVLPATLGFTALALLLSAASRSGPVGIGGPLVIGLLMQVCSLSGAADPIRGLLLTVPFNAWHGFFVSRPFYGPLYEGLVTSAVYFVVCLGATYAVFRRRDIAVG